MNNLSERDWRRLIEAIRRRKCVLITGPDVAFDPDDPQRGSLAAQLAERLAASLPSSIPLGKDEELARDSVYIQFSDSINQRGEPVYRMDEPGVRDSLRRINLILAGHTHGGQVRFPVIGALDNPPGHKIIYDKGLFGSGGTKMYVNRGIGTTLLPMRFLSSPEITVFKFVKEYEKAYQPNS